MDAFLAEAEAAAKQVEDRQRVLINGLTKIAGIVSRWHDEPFFPFDDDGMLQVELGRPQAGDGGDGFPQSDDGTHEQAFPTSFQQLDSGLQRLWQQRLQVIADGSRVVQRVLGELPKELKLARAPPAWHDFCSYVDALVFSGVVRAIVRHLGDLQKLLLGVTAERDVKGAVASAEAQIEAGRDGRSGSAAWSDSDYG